MKAVAQLVTSILALAGLLHGVAAHATSLAELPLKASVLAKPNVIFGLDDSGSMDSEIMIGTNDGAFWWDYNARTGWDGSGVPHYNAAGNANTQWRKMVYLFPNGTASGARVYNDATSDHFAVMPTSQFAWLRSSSYNPIYYNPAINYAAWAPGYVGGALVTYGNANTASVKSHPVHGTGTFNLTTDRALTQTANNIFMALPGMVIPQDAQHCDHTNCTTWTTVTDSTGYTVPAASVRRVAMAYFPATYYVKETCTVDGSSCVSAPDGSTLKRYEIKTGNTFPSGRTVANELQNFANWFQYTRKRKLMLSAAMGEVLEPLTGMRMGVVKLNANAAVTIYDTDSTNPANNGRKVAGIIYETNGSGGTPTRETLKYIGEQYRNNNALIQYACQRNNAFILTDGFANASAVAPPGYAQATWGSGAPFATTHANSLADIALSYYTINLRPLLATGVVPPTATDLNTNLHMNVYGLTLGAKGVLFVDNDTAVPTDTSAWVNPTQNRHPSAVDDLWHATINARGKMYLATTPEETALKIQAALTDIISAVGAQGGFAVSSVNLDRGDSQAYLGTYNPSGWAGDLTANPIDANTAEVGTTPNWSANTKLVARDWTTRAIVTSNAAGGGVVFNTANVGSTVNPDSVTFTNDQVVEYLRGNRTGEGDTVRRRSALIGAVINSEPVLDRDTGMVFVASSEGMVHALDTATGTEQWAYVPYDTLATIGQQVQRGWVFKTQLDGPLTVRKLSNDSRLLVGGLGAAGRSYFAINVTTPSGISESQAAGNVLWTFPTTGDTANRANMGYTLGKPLIVKSRDDGDVVLVTSGYDNGLSLGDGRGRMWMLNATTGAVIHEFVTTEGSPGNEAGLAQLSALRDANGVQYVYGGDLKGNVWKFDLLNKTTSLLATLVDGSNNRQPVTAAPELTEVEGNIVILVGTGRLLDITDFGNSAVQTFYAITDGATISNLRGSLTQRIYTRDSGSPTLDGSITGADMDWGTSRGWYMDLPAGEQSNTNPTVAYGAVAFVTNVNGGSNCAQSAFLYLLDVGTGKKVPDGDFGTGFVSERIASNATSSRVITLRVVDGQLVGTTHRSDNSVFRRTLPLGKTIAPGKNSWREITR
ncbi:MAG: pilus assembly protein [Aquabacterium sp.]